MLLECSVEHFERALLWGFHHVPLSCSEPWKSIPATQGPELPIEYPLVPGRQVGTFLQGVDDIGLSALTEDVKADLP